MSESTDFGYKKVPLEEKQQHVNEVFHRVADRYDLMNDILSLGIHRLWKRHAIAGLFIRPFHTILDIAGGTGDLASLMWPQIKSPGKIVLADINNSMLQVGRDRLVDRGQMDHLFYVQTDAECLPFTDTFDKITIAFGLRNVPRKEHALQSMYQALKPGGQLMILEFSHPTWIGLEWLYKWYSFNIVPKLGQWVAQDAPSYQYLVESIQKHPSQTALIQMMQDAQFEDCRYENLTGGIVAIHRGVKY